MAAASAMHALMSISKGSLALDRNECPNSIERRALPSTDADVRKITAFCNWSENWTMIKQADKADKKIFRIAMKLREGSKLRTSSVKNKMHENIIAMRFCPFVRTLTRSDRPNETDVTTLIYPLPIILAGITGSINRIPAANMKRNRAIHGVTA